MSDTTTHGKPSRPKGPSIFGIVKPYKGAIIGLLALAIGSNALNLTLPKIIAQAIDTAAPGASLSSFVLEFFALAIGVALLAYAQSVTQIYTSERVARDLRERVAAKISMQSYQYIQTTTPSKLLTNLTSDIDAVKLFVSQAIVSIVSSIFLIIGASVLLISINARLAIATLAILPLIVGSFYGVFSRVGPLFGRVQGTIDRLNKVINESILGASLIRVLHAQREEYDKFLEVNGEAKDIGLKILRLFASVIPVITFLSSLATIIILLYGGHLVIGGTMTLGELAAFNSYLSILIFPIFIIGFMSNAIARASASYGRVSEVLLAPEPIDTGTIVTSIQGNIEVKNVRVAYGEKQILQDVSFAVKAGTRTALLGPTAAGKSQLLSVMTGLLPVTSGTISYDGHALADYEKRNFYKQVSLVFQDSVMFNLSVRENIALRGEVSDAALEKAIQTAELHDFIGTLPEGLETNVSERGTSLSGGQKQRIMLARALALEPTVLFLDDFTARVDANTEERILKNLGENYPGLTLISVTQKITSVKDFDQIILLMEGEVIASGTHAELMSSSPEYVQIFESQQSTNHYEEHASI